MGRGSGEELQNGDDGRRYIADELQDTDCDSQRKHLLTGKWARGLGEELQNGDDGRRYITDELQDTDCDSQRKHLLTGKSGVRIRRTVAGV
ncbi:hypothetical protein ACFOUO_03180 [Salinithrix halophila]|uniref:Uncharacterized protein n=2 Tax=Salinithrix halophila TaxID=1485204 RepID=A0ABV8JF16_9BACL